MNEWMNDEAVYRTAPATPGLLISVFCEVCSLESKSYSVQGFLDDWKTFLHLSMLTTNGKAPAWSMNESEQY